MSNRRTPAVIGAAAVLAACAGVALPGSASADQVTTTSTDSPVTLTEVIDDPMVTGTPTDITFIVHNTSTTETAVGFSTAPGPARLGPSIEESLPSGMVFRSARGQRSCTVNNAGVINPGTHFNCRIPQLGPGQTKRLVVTALPKSPTPTQAPTMVLAQLQGTLERDVAHPTYEDGFAPAIYPTYHIVSGPTDLQLAGSLSSSTIAPGSTFRYRYLIRNVSDSDAVGVVLQSTLPAGLTPLSGTVGRGGSCSVDHQTVTCQTLPYIVAGAAEPASITVRAADVPATYRASATVTESNVDTDVADNTLTLSTPVGS